jgi:hypothetical protein
VGKGGDVDRDDGVLVVFCGVVVAGEGIGRETRGGSTEEVATANSQR